MSPLTSIPVAIALAEKARQTIEQQQAEIKALRAALLGVWDYATTGASLHDVNTYEQPQFVEARRLLTECLPKSKLKIASDAVQDYLDKFR